MRQPAVPPHGPVSASKDRFVRIRLAGDSGDGVQTTGALFTQSAADFGNDFATYPDYPAEIRAPAGTKAGVSAFSLSLGAEEVWTHGDRPDMLVAFNAAALAMHLPSLPDGGLLLLDSSGMTPRLLQKAGFAADPRSDGSLDRVRLLEVDVSAHVQRATAEHELTRKQALRARNMWVLGLAAWLFERDPESIAGRISRKFAGAPAIAAANLAAFRAGHAHGEVHEVEIVQYRVSLAPAPAPKGLYRSVTGTEAIALGMVAAARLADRPLFYASYPITPASPVLHQLARLNASDITVFQAEDEIGGIGAALGAAFGGSFGVTASSGPGISLMTEMLGLGIAAELPLLAIDIQRAGPSTGMPTKTAQSDLLLAWHGRSGDAPLPVVAARSPSDCFDAVIEAARIAIRHMTPVILLADAYLANAAVPWRLPEPGDLDSDAFRVDAETDRGERNPFRRDPATLGRSWILPGTPGREHRIGGLERDARTGEVSYDPGNHRTMTEIRCGKLDRIRESLPAIQPDTGAKPATLAVVAWGSTYGAIQAAVRELRAEGRAVDHVHLRHLAPTPPDLEAVLDSYDEILIPEMNMGQLAFLLRGSTKARILSFRKVTGQPFLEAEIADKIREATA